MHFQVDKNCNQCFDWEIEEETKFEGRGANESVPFVVIWIHFAVSMGSPCKDWKTERSFVRVPDVVGEHWTGM